MNGEPAVGTKPTPGPWETVGATRIWRTGENGGAVAIVAEPECKRSDDFHEVETSSKRWDEAMANAQLIAAAPKLLAACEAVLPWVAISMVEKTEPHPQAVKNFEADFALLKEAITDATGKTFPH